MKVDDGKYELRRVWGGVLKLDPLLQCAKVIPKVWYSCRLNARENDLLAGWLRSGIRQQAYVLYLTAPSAFRPAQCEARIGAVG